MLNFILEHIIFSIVYTGPYHYFPVIRTISMWYPSFWCRKQDNFSCLLYVLLVFWLNTNLKASSKIKQSEFVTSRRQVPYLLEEDEPVTTLERREQWTNLALCNYQPGWARVESPDTLCEPDWHLGNNLYCISTWRNLKCSSWGSRGQLSFDYINLAEDNTR